MPQFPPVQFLTSSWQPRQFPPDQGVEVAFAGRSNAGKSSALNAITGRKDLARTSKTPGRTQLINFFALNERQRLADLPGYGFAKVPEKMRQHWRELMERYVETRASLGGIADGDTSRFAALASATALLVAVIAFVAWFVRAGAIVNFISESVMVGFKCGVALFLASTQLPKLFGVHGAHGDFWENSVAFLKHLSETNTSSLAIGGAALTLLIVAGVWLLVGAVAAAWALRALIW